jgi:Na+/H+-translocating membrane pyrophosphatase
MKCNVRRYASVSDAIREGADGFFAVQYSLIGKLAAVLAVVIYVIYSIRALTKEQEAAGLTQQTFAWLTTLSFLLGAVCSGASGYVGMWVSVRANVRVAGAARRSAREALQVALRAGGFAAIVVVAMVVLGVAVLFTVFSYLFDVGRAGGMDIHELPLMLVGYGGGLCKLNAVVP